MWEDGEFSRNIKANDEKWQKEYAQRDRDAQRSRSSSGGVTAAGGGGIAGLIIFLIILDLITGFFRNNWISIVIILGAIVACIIACIIISAYVRRAALVKFITIAATIGLIIGVFSLGIAKNDGNFKKWEKTEVIVNFPRTGNWTVTCHGDRKDWTVNLVITSFSSIYFDGYFDWSNGIDKYGKELFKGEYDYMTNIASITGYVLVDAEGINLGNYSAELSKDRKDFISGVSDDNFTWEAKWRP